MANAFNLFSALAVLLLVLAMAFLTHARPLETPEPTLEARLKLDADSPSCWESLTQIQSCSGEVILFFLNGETYLGDACCHAIHTISHQCWPDMMETLGYTTEEGDILEGYCDQEIADSPPSPPSVMADMAAPVKGLLH
ncbi:abscisic stress-ripening protein 1-like [Hibiscus syriacus]|uniref:Abscisic stress-ripening protein 1-like n=1 Tax=Hibiscus syriacus TaxID=106335 RepID=A0A6A2YYN8_HIBSY|nr:egg cell-secreted protein 1.1-like [Hibiscus syriacus]KAE8684379.1 abscisic stress-ripening protein 1-like [Hibiscus syriacus]